MATYSVSRLGLNLGTFPSHDLALRFLTEHCAGNEWHRLSDYKMDYVTK